MNELYHHGIKGQKWGLRRFQKSDGTLTAEGKSRYNNHFSSNKDKKKFMKEVKRGLNSTKPQELLDLYNKTSSMVKKELTKEEKEQYKDLYKKKTESSSQKEWKDLDDRQREIGYSVAKRILGESGDVKVTTLNINDKKSPYYAKDWIDEIIKDEVRKEIPRQ